MTCRCSHVGVVDAWLVASWFMLPPSTSPSEMPELTDVDGTCYGKRA